MQVEDRAAPGPVYETLEPEPGAGLATLPEPSPDDVFMDFEGDPFVGPGGMEYLFGYVTDEGSGPPVFTAHWALSAEEEKLCFERLVDWLTERWETHPDMHIYHFAPYEPSAMKRLMSRYATREDEVDRMLRAGLFVDLYRVVRGAIRAGVESYSIKELGEVLRVRERGAHGRRQPGTVRGDRPAGAGRPGRLSVTSTGRRSSPTTGRLRLDVPPP